MGKHSAQITILIALILFSLSLFSNAEENVRGGNQVQLNKMVYLLDTITFESPKLIRQESLYYLIDGYVSKQIDSNDVYAKEKLIYNALLWREMDDISQFLPYSDSLYMPSYVTIIPDSTFCKGKVKSFSFEKNPVFIIALVNVDYFNRNNRCIDCLESPPFIISEDPINRYVRVAYPLFHKRDYPYGL